MKNYSLPDEITEDEIINQNRESNKLALEQLQKNQKNWQFFKNLIKQNEKEILTMYYYTFVNYEQLISNKPTIYLKEDFMTNWEQNIEEYFKLSIVIFSQDFNPNSTELFTSKEESFFLRKNGRMYNFILKDCLENISPQIRLAQWKNSQEMNKILDGNE